MPPRFVWAIGLIILAGWLNLWLPPSPARPKLTLIQGGRT